MIVPFTDRVKKAWVCRVSGFGFFRRGANPPGGGEDGWRRKNRDSEEQGVTLWFILNWS
jgi:hypothetical protein